MLPPVEDEEEDDPSVAPLLPWDWCALPQRVPAPSIAAPLTPAPSTPRRALVLYSTLTAFARETIGLTLLRIIETLSKAPLRIAQHAPCHTPHAIRHTPRATRCHAPPRAAPRPPHTRYIYATHTPHTRHTLSYPTAPRCV